MFTLKGAPVNANDVDRISILGRRGEAEYVHRLQEEGVWASFRPRASPALPTNGCRSSRMAQLLRAWQNFLGIFCSPRESAPPHVERRDVAAESGNRKFTRSFRSRGPVIRARTGSIGGATDPTSPSERLERRVRRYSCDQLALSVGVTSEWQPPHCRRGAVGLLPEEGSAK